MFRTDNSSSATTQPAFAPASTPGYYTSGSMSLSIPPTTIAPDELNIISDEISYVVTRNGLTLDKTDTTQLYQAIVAMGYVPPADPEPARAEAAEAVLRADLALKAYKSEIFNPYFASATVYCVAYAAGSAGASLTVACSGYLFIIGSRNLSAQDTSGGNLIDLYHNGGVVDYDSSQSSGTLLRTALCTAGAQSVLIASTAGVDFSLHISLLFVPFLQ